MTEEDLKNKWMATMLTFDWSKEKGLEENDNANEENKEVLA